MCFYEQRVREGGKSEISLFPTKTKFNMDMVVLHTSFAANFIYSFGAEIVFQNRKSLFRKRCRKSEGLTILKNCTHFVCIYVIFRNTGCLH